MISLLKWFGLRSGIGGAPELSAAAAGGRNALSRTMRAPDKIIGQGVSRASGWQAVKIVGLAGRERVDRLGDICGAQLRLDRVVFNQEEAGHSSSPTVVVEAICPAYASIKSFPLAR